MCENFVKTKGKEGSAKDLIEQRADSAKVNASYAKGNATARESTRQRKETRQREIQHGCAKANAAHAKGGKIVMIYYVEDDTNIRELTIYALRQAGFEATGFAAAREFFAACKEQIPELVLLDIMLPETDGLEILHIMRADAAMKHLPVMMLTAKGTEYDTVCGLDAGADDYLSKPFGMMELVSRVNALLRRSQAPAVTSADELVQGPIKLVLSSRVASVGDVMLFLTLKEFDLLRTLMQNAGHVLSRAQLLEEVWGITYVGETRTVDVHIQTLRQKLAAAGKKAAKALTESTAGTSATKAANTDALAAKKQGVANTEEKQGSAKAAKNPSVEAEELFSVDAWIQTVRGVGYCLKKPLRMH